MGKVIFENVSLTTCDVSFKELYILTNNWISGATDQVQSAQFMLAWIQLGHRVPMQNDSEGAFKKSFGFQMYG